ncbi:penicillin acylase family protein [Nocardioides sp. LHG3406-4]|uniref:penicillin acylase family protein n=1 Tax=Nocardioides sp. LHG3406-4 TaxID=2804575 RepID=UPI003CE837D0
MAIHRDAWGIPHITATSVLAMAREQGRACVEDRAEQLRLDRLRGEGRTAELTGTAGLEWDCFARRALLDETGRRAYDGSAAETQAFLAAYADGVNDALPADHEPWHPWTPATVFLVHHILFGTFPSKLWRHHAGEALGEEGADLFRLEGPPNGSNAYAVGGGRTATGRPLIAGDPHRQFEDPNVYAQVRLECPEFDVAGFAFPGVPGIQHFGHAGGVAWAITNATADYQDVFRETAETLAGARRRTETIEVRGGEPVAIEVVVTDRGPVVFHLADGGWSLRTPSLVLGALGLDALLPLLRARTADDVDRALDHWVEPVNNVVIADAAGTVRRRVAGRVPRRRDGIRRTPGHAGDGHGWAGWVDELPRTEASPDGYVVTANDRATPAYDAIGLDFAPPHRARRITELLEAQPRLDVSAAGAVLADVRQTGGEALLARIAALDGLVGRDREVADRLAAWDREMTVDSEEAALFVRLRDHLVQGICAAGVLRALRAPSPYGDLLAPWFSLEARVAASIDTLLAHGRPWGLPLEPLLRDAVSAAGRAHEERWGDVHRYQALSQHGVGTAPALPLPGDTHCVLATGWFPGLDVSVRGPVARYVWCLADREASRWAVPLGASGDPGSPHHHDQQQTWALGGTLPLAGG